MEDGGYPAGRNTAPQELTPEASGSSDHYSSGEEDVSDQSQDCHVAEKRKQIECPLCRERHPRACGQKCFIEAECPICWADCSPIIMMPCGHGLCEDDFARQGGILKASGRGGEPKVANVRCDDGHFIVLSNIPCPSPNRDAYIPESRKIPDGARVQVILSSSGMGAFADEASEGWCWVRGEGAEGFVQSKYLRDVPVAATVSLCHFENLVTRLLAKTTLDNGRHVWTKPASVVGNGDQVWALWSQNYFTWIQKEDGSQGFMQTSDLKFASM